MSTNQTNQPEGLPSKEDFATLMQRMSEMSEQIRLLTEGNGPPLSRRENTSQQAEQGSQLGDDLEEARSQECVGHTPPWILGRLAPSK